MVNNLSCKQELLTGQTPITEINLSVKISLLFTLPKIETEIKGLLANDLSAWTFQSLFSGNQRTSTGVSEGPSPIPDLEPQSY